MKINILDFIDFERVNTLLEGFNRTTGFVTAILDLDGNVLSKSGWRQICTRFHRVHPETAQKCVISDTVLANKMKDGETYHFYQCLNGLIDVAVPIVIRGEHVANLFSGQFFFETPDLSFFERQADTYGFNKKVYLDAVENVPIMSQESVKTAMQFLLNMTEMISEMTFQKLEQVELNKQRKAVENSLRESEARFKALHNASFGGITIHDKGIILDCNQGLSDMTGYSIDELIGMDGLLLIAESSRSMVMDNIVSGYEKPYEATGLRKTGEEYPMRLEARNIPYKGKNVRTVEFRDITEQKVAEQERENLQAQLIQAQKIESVGRLAGGVAHDFNNMLSIILGNIEIIQEDIDPNDPLVSNIYEVKKAAERSADLTRQLLAFARKQTISPKVINPNLAIEGMLKMLKRLIGEDIDLLWRPEAQVWPVKIDPSQLDHILANLCVNARDAIKDVGNVTIETDNVCFDDSYCREHRWTSPGEFVLIGVSDNGCGMGKDTIDKLFEPFFTTKENGAGTGLGLATVYGIIKQNKGFVHVYSEPGQGTTIKLYIPRHIESQAAGPVIREETSRKGSETILVVEDERPILKMIKTMLERLEYRVLSANTPEAAIAIANASSQKIDLLLTDVVMPSMNGRELARTILKAFPNIKCLYMSGYTSNVIAHRGILDEGLNFINKPFSRQELSAKVRAIMEEPK